MYAALLLRLYTKGRRLRMSAVDQPLKKLFSTPWSAPEESPNTPGGYDPLLISGDLGAACRGSCTLTSTCWRRPKHPSPVFQGGNEVETWFSTGFPNSTGVCHPDAPAMHGDDQHGIVSFARANATMSRRLARPVDTARLQTERCS